MKQIPKILSLLLLTGLTASISAAMGEHLLNLNPVLSALAGVALMFLLSCLPSPAHTQGLVTNGIQKEIWAKQIMGGIFKNNEFLQYAFNADEYVLAGKVVHIPQAAAPSNVVKNRNSLPATITKRVDTDVVYVLDEYTTDPRRIDHADKYELSYDKLQSIIEEDQAALRETVAENMIINWAPGGIAIVRTTGASAAAHLPGQTGTRKSTGHKDLLAMMTLFNQQGVSQDDRYAMYDAVMYSQLIDSLSPTQFADFSKYLDAEKGVLGKLHSFNIMMRSTVATFDNSATPVIKAYGAAGAATDNAGALFWQKNSVERAMSEVFVFEHLNNPEFFGDVYSFLLRAGGRARRADLKGVAALVQIV